MVFWPFVICNTYAWTNAWELPFLFFFFSLFHFHIFHSYWVKRKKNVFRIAWICINWNFALRLANVTFKTVLKYFSTLLCKQLNGDFYYIYSIFYMEIYALHSVMYRVTKYFFNKWRWFDYQEWLVLSKRRKMLCLICGQLQSSFCPFRKNGIEKENNNSDQVKREKKKRRNKRKKYYSQRTRCKVYSSLFILSRLELIWLSVSVSVVILIDWFDYQVVKL